MDLAPERWEGSTLSDRLLIYWEENGTPVNILSEDERGYWINHNKVAVESWGTAERFVHPVSWLSSCDVCGHLRTKRKIRDVPWEWRWFADIRHPADDVCVPCYNKILALVKRLKVIDELELLTKQLNNKRLECQRLQRKRLEKNY